MSNLILPQQFDIEQFGKIALQKRSSGNPGTRVKCKYKNIITAFDIETTRIAEIEQSFMYVWKWQFGTEYTVKGRTWEQFLWFAKMLSGLLGESEYLCIFVHNLSYEFQFLRGVYDFAPNEVFALDSRKVLKCTMFDHLEMRCSYIHSNMSLDEYTHKMGAEHGKLSGDEYDYKTMRYPWTDLTPYEEDYTTNDVLGLVEAIQIEMEHDGDNLYTFPLTSTGYVRRDAKKAMRAVSYTFVQNQLADYDIYAMCREAFRGGNTHANRYYSGVVLHGVKSADRSSSYPDVLCNCKFPVSQFHRTGAMHYEELLELINVRKKAVLMRVTITNIRLKNRYFGAPYLSRDKCRNIHGAIYDNGRILEAEYLETTLTDVDFQILLGEYEFDDLVPLDVAHARYGNLPAPLLDIIIQYYEAKTALKNVDGQDIYYMKAKNKLNSIYGMMAQDPVKQTIDFYLEEGFIERNESPKDLLAAANRRAFLCYQWGVWTTAWARYRLEEGIMLAGDGFVYCDTDSVKYIGNVDWTTYNAERIKDSKQTGAYAADPKGDIYYMGVFESEGEYEEFSTLGAKKYCYRKRGEKLSVTIAGVTKKKGGKELEAAGGIAAFAPGFIFREAGGTEAIYNDKPPITTYTAEGRQIAITSNVVLRDSTYTLGITAEYERLLEFSRRGIDIQ